MDDPPVPPALVSPEDITLCIISLRGQKVILDNDLARLYCVSTGALNQAVTRNPARLPEDFMFRLTTKELANWRSQIVISTPAARMGIRHAPRAFTEQGVAMLSSVLRSERAIQVNVAIMRAFVHLRRFSLSYSELCSRIDAIEGRF